MTEEEEDRFVAIIGKALSMHSAGQYTDTALHAEHHRAVAEWISRENRRRERWDKIAQSVAGSLIVAAVTGVLSVLCWLGRLALAGLQHTGGNPPPGH